MAIKVTHDGTSPHDCCAERCFNCRAPTRHWYTRKDVAVCLECAAVVRPSDVPSKSEWCAKEAALTARVV